MNHGESAIKTLREASKEKKNVTPTTTTTTLPPTRYMFAAMTAPGPLASSPGRGVALSALSLSRLAGAVLALPPLCVGKWWIDQYETDRAERA